MDVITCANFSWTWGGFPPCQSMWCANYYHMNGEVDFHMKEWHMEEKNKGRFEEKWIRIGEGLKCLEVRLGDHIIAPFERDL